MLKDQRKLLVTLFVRAILLVILFVAFLATGIHLIHAVSAWVLRVILYTYAVAGGYVAVGKTSIPRGYGLIIFTTFGIITLIEFVWIPRFFGIPK